MRSKSLAKVLLVVAGLLMLAAAPVRAAETLVLTCKVCDVVIATGKGLPANDTVRLSMTDVRSGQEVISGVAVQTDADGAFVKSLPLDLTRHPSLQSSVWKEEGSALVVAAHTRFTAPCKPKAESLPLTGGNTPLLLGLGVGLLAAGLLLTRSTRHRPRHAAH